MTKKDFIALADMIRHHNQFNTHNPFSPAQVKRLADFCKSTNSNFMKDRWLDYIAGNCGKNGGAVKKQHNLV
jgi:hypothetical protein